MTRKSTLRIFVVSILLALLVSMFTVIAASAQSSAPIHAASRLSFALVSNVTPNSNIEKNGKDLDVFRPNQLHCKIVQGQWCHTITNKTRGSVDVYLNGGYYFTQPPGQTNYISYSNPDTYVYTIPNQNPKAQLIVFVTN